MEKFIKIINVIFLISLTTFSTFDSAKANSKHNEDSTQLEVDLIHFGHSLQGLDYAYKSISVISQAMAYEQKLSQHSNESASQLNFQNVQIVVIESGIVGIGKGHWLELSKIREYPNYVSVEVIKHFRHKNDHCLYPAEIFSYFEMYAIKTTKPVLLAEKISSKIQCPPEKNYHAY